MATYYWVGGAGTWDGTTTTNWATTSGGAGGAGVPTTADTATFDGSSGTGAVTITAASNSAVCNFGGSGITATLNANHPTAFGVLNISAGTFNCSTFNLELSIRAITVTGGTFTCNGGVINAGSLASSGSTASTINLNASTLTLSSSAGINFSSTGLTFNAGTSQINLSTNGPTFNGNGSTFYNVSFTGNSITTAYINGANTFNNLAFAGKGGQGLSIIYFFANQTINGTLTVYPATTLGSSRYYFQSATYGVPTTLTGNTASLVDVDFLDIAHSGATWAGTRLGDCGGNSGIAFDTPKTVYWNLAGTNQYDADGWAMASSGVPNVVYFPLAQDTAVFTDNNPAAGSTITVSQPYNIGTLDFSSRTNTLTFSVPSVSPTFFGNITLSSVITMSGVVTFYLWGRSTTQTITSAGVSFNQIFRVNAIGSTIVFNGAFTTVYDIYLNSGTLNLAGYTVTARNFLIQSGSTKNITFNGGTLLISGSGASAFRNLQPANFTTTAGTGVGVISFTSASAKTFTGAGSTYNCTLNQGGAGAITFASTGDTINNITNTAQPTTITFTSAYTTNFNNFNLNGTAGNLVTVKSTTVGTKSILVKSSGTVSVSYCSIIDSNATGGATWQAYTTNGNVDAGNNSGWVFSAGISVALTEAASAIDSEVSYASLGSAVTETITGVENQTSYINTNIAISETGTATDTQYALASFGVVQNESISSVDTINAGIGLLNSLTETVAAVDSQSLNSLYSTALNEAGVVSETQYSTVSYSAVIQENITASDAQALLVNFAAVLTESLSATDTQVSLANTVANIIETMVASDSEAGVLTAIANLTEVVIASESTNAAAIYQTLVLEQLLAVDSQTSRFLWELIDDIQSPNWTTINTLGT